MLIHYLATHKHRYTFDRYLQDYGQPVAHLVRVSSYREALQVQHPAPGIYIFSDLERLNGAGLQRAAHLYEQLAARGDTRCNDPRQVLSRFRLLHRLHAEGRNRFRAHRADSDPGDWRWPVFLRHAHQHHGALSVLLDTPQQVHEAQHALAGKGYTAGQLLAVEFCDVRDTDGLVRKYSAFLVNGQVLPRHLFFSREWELKFSDVVDEQRLEEEWTYLRTNPHEQAIREVFALAHIEYGRIDYSLLDKRMQVWEINTNPQIATFADGGGVLRKPVHAWFGERMNRALQRLAGVNPV